MDPCAGHECEPECDHAEFDPRQTAGEGLCLPEYTAVFYDPHRPAAGRIFGSAEVIRKHANDFSIRGFSQNTVYLIVQIRR